MDIADVSSRSIAQLVSLAGCTAVVTGRGLGKAIALRFGEAGANVVIGDIDMELATAAAADLQARYGGRTVGVHMDVADTATIVAAAGRTLLADAGEAI